MICNEATAWLKEQSAEIQSLVLDPFAPTKYRATAKMKARRGDVERAHFLHFLSQKSIRDSGRTVERSPEEGRRKRATKIACDSVKLHFPVLDCDTNSVIYTGCLEAARYRVDSNNGERRGN